MDKLLQVADDVSLPADVRRRALLLHVETIKVLDEASGLPSRELTLNDIRNHKKLEEVFEKIVNHYNPGPNWIVPGLTDLKENLNRHGANITAHPSGIGITFTFGNWLRASKMGYGPRPANLKGIVGLYNELFPPNVVAGEN